MFDATRTLTAQPAMVTRTFGRVVATWHGPGAPSDAEWSVFLTALRTTDLKTARGFVLTAGGAPSASQRRAMVDIVGVRPVPIAVVSDQIGVRFVASMLAMMTRRIRSFSPAELPEAYAHLELSPTERRGADAFVAELGTPTRRGSVRRPSM
ncbi:MAG: hypothetical protein ABW252_04635 [Polyangiales bacterium]